MNDDEAPSGGLLCGITAWHVRVLCDNPWEGGGAYTPAQVGDMTLDQVLMRLTDRKFLLRRDNKMEPTLASPLADKDGVVRGVAADGTEIRGRIRGKSRARELMEAERERLKVEKQNKRERDKGK